MPPCSTLVAPHPAGPRPLRPVAAPRACPSPRLRPRTGCPGGSAALHSPAGQVSREQSVTSGMAVPSGQTFEEVRRALAGSQSGLEELDRRFRPRLEIRFAAWMSSPTRFNPNLRRRVLLDDVVQETLLRAYRDMAQVTDPRQGSFWKWLCVVGRHAMLDAIRRATTDSGGVQREQHAHEVGGERLDPLAAVPARDARPARQAHERELHERLGQAIAALPPREGFVVKEVYLSGRSLDEVGALLGIQKVRVHQLKARALQALKRALGGSTAFLRLLAST